MRLGKSACLRPQGLGYDEEGLGCVGIGVGRVLTKVDEERLETSSEAQWSNVPFQDAAQCTFPYNSNIAM